MVYILLGNGFEETEAIAPCDILRRAGVDVRLVGLGGREISGGHGITVCADLTVEQMDPGQMEMIVLPGGMGGVHSILACPPALEAVRRAWQDGRWVAAICAAPTILGKRGWIDGKHAVCYPGMEAQMGKAVVHPEQEAVADGKLITGRAPGAAIEFGLRLAGVLPGSFTPDEVAGYMVYARR